MPCIPVPAELAGVRPHELPDITLPEGYILDDHPLHRDRVTSLYTLPGYPGLVLRKHSLAPDAFESSRQVYDLLASGLDHYARLAQHGLYVPPHRHIDIQMPQGGAEGRVISLARYMPAIGQLSLTSVAQLPASLHVLSGLSHYAADIAADGHPDALWDIFRKEQYGLHSPRNDLPLTPQGVFLQDYGLVLGHTEDRLWIGNYSTNYFLHARANLRHMAVQVLLTARNTSFELRAHILKEFIHSRLPRAVILKK